MAGRLRFENMRDRHVSKLINAHVPFRQVLSKSWVVLGSQRLVCSSLPRPTPNRPPAPARLRVDLPVDPSR